MKTNHSFSLVARKAALRATIILCVAGSSTLTSCNKESTKESKSDGVRINGLVGDNPNTTNARGAGVGPVGSFYYSLFFTNKTGMTGATADIQPETSGKFTLTFDKCGDVIGGEGWQFTSETRKIGYTINSLSGSDTYNFVGVYGWTGQNAQPPVFSTAPNPNLREYYIVEKGTLTGSTNPNDPYTRITVDGHDYRCYINNRTNAPSVEGTKDFIQIVDSWGGQTNASGTVTFQGHVTNWKKYPAGKKWISANPGYQLLAIESFKGIKGNITATVKQL